MMAKHYLVKSTSGAGLGASLPGKIDHHKPGIKRHYTEAFAMRAEVKRALLDLATRSPAAKPTDTVQVLSRWLQSNNRDNLALTIKNYGGVGLSGHIHDDLAEKTHVFQIKGPMGKGLDFKTGKHVAYAAGTGVLVFMDLVAHLILKKVNPSLLDETQLPDDFKLELYTSFASRESAIGLDLIEALHNLCAEDSEPMFKHIPRFSSDKTWQTNVRWDEAYFVEQFT